jgi:hypothetical protein
MSRMNRGLDSYPDFRIADRMIIKFRDGTITAENKGVNRLFNSNGKDFWGGNRWYKLKIDNSREWSEF